MHDCIIGQAVCTQFTHCNAGKTRDKGVVCATRPDQSTQREGALVQNPGVNHATNAEISKITVPDTNFVHLAMQSRGTTVAHKAKSFIAKKKCTAKIHGEYQVPLRHGCCLPPPAPLEVTRP